MADWGYMTTKERKEREREIYARLDGETREVEMTHEDAQRMLCRTCKFYASILIGGYGLTRDDPWRLYGCRCKYKYVWVYIVK